MTQLLTQNAKMKKSSINGLKVFNFGIPAFKSISGMSTCPSASTCVKGCYARDGAYNWTPTKKAYEYRLTATLTENFVEVMDKLIKAKAKRTKQLVIRIHDSGDFYNAAYATKWFAIMDKNPSVRFYAYTKMVRMFKEFQKVILLPDNFTLIYSFGGKDDNLIDTKVDRHALVFERGETLLERGYVDSSDDDMIAAMGESNRIGLVYHGTRKFSNTTWKNV